jgi:hypothetical protein
MVNTFFLFYGCVDQASMAVVEKWGCFIRLSEPDLHFFNPFAGECIAAHHPCLVTRCLHRDQDQGSLILTCSRFLVDCSLCR